MGGNVDAGYLRQKYGNVSLRRLELTDRRRDLRGGENRRCHLIQQRLKYVVVAAVDQDQFGIAVPQRVCRREPRKAAADYDDAGHLRLEQIPVDGEVLQRALGFRARHSVGRRLGLVDTVSLSAQFGHPNLPRHAARRSVTLPQTWASPSTSASMSASLCSGVGVIRKRSVPVGTVG